MNKRPACGLREAAVEAAARAGRLVPIISAIALGSAPARAQRPVTLAEAIAAAEATAPSLAVALADSAAARAALSRARAFPDPALSLDYSESPPRHHVDIEQPIEYPWVRSARIRGGREAVEAARLGAVTERELVRYRVEVAYAAAAGGSALRALARQNVADGRELLRSVRARASAGDASELDVELAEVTLGQLERAALDDSLSAVQAIFSLQALMGVPLDSVRVQPADSLGTRPAVPPSPAMPSRVAAAERQLAAASAELALARRRRLPAPSLRAGFEEGDPSGGETGLLPTVGVTIALPLFGAADAEVARARAAEGRAEAELAAARREGAVTLVLAERTRDLAARRLEADREAVRHATRVAQLSATAYREGAYPIATVLEAQRNARDALRRYIDDLIASRTAAAAYRLAVIAGGPTP